MQLFMILCNLFWQDGRWNSSNLVMLRILILNIVSLLVLYSSSAGISLYTYLEKYYYWTNALKTKNKLLNIYFTHTHRNENLVISTNLAIWPVKYRTIPGVQLNVTQTYMRRNAIETLSPLLTLCEANPLVLCGFPSQGSIMCRQLKTVESIWVAGDLKRHDTHCVVMIMICQVSGTYHFLNSLHFSKELIWYIEREILSFWRKFPLERAMKISSKCRHSRFSLLSHLLV